MAAPDFATAREYYEAAEAEATSGHFDEALRDYEQAYALTKDPVLFYKLAATQERAGHCDRAIPLYQRYLDEAHPSPDFAGKAAAHMKGCAPRGQVIDPFAEPEPVPAAAPPPGAPKLDLHMAPTRRAAWLLAGASGGLVVIGSILAYAASSSENDVRDLYVGVGSMTPQYTGATKTRYAELVAQGHRYEHESWATFGAAGGTAIAAAICFAISGSERITPIVTPGGGGVSVRF